MTRVLPCAVELHDLTKSFGDLLAVDEVGPAQRGIETHADLDAHHGQPRPSPEQPDHTLPDSAMQGQTTDQGTRPEA